MPRVEFTYIATRPLDCGMPDGSIHTYQAGDVIPAEVLGRSIGALILADKVARMAINVADADDPAPVVEETNEPDAEEDAPAAEDSDFPRHLGSGIYELSNGNHIKGKTKAEQAEASL